MAKPPPANPPPPAGFAIVVPMYEYRNFYVGKSGNDKNDGLTASTPWLTINKAASWISQNVFISAQAIAGISIGDGVYDESVYLGSTFGGGYATLQGNSSDTSAVKISPTTGYCCFCAYGPGEWSISSMKMECLTNGSLGLISHYGAGGTVSPYNVVFGKNVNGPIAYCHPGGSGGRIILQGFEVTDTSSHLAICDTDGYIENSHGTNILRVNPGWASVYKVARFGRVYDASGHNMSWQNFGGYAGPKYAVVEHGSLHSTSVAGIPGVAGTCDPSGRVSSGGFMVT